jgi:hypothetical protein
MAIGTVTEYSEPEPGSDRQVNRPQDDALLRARATAAIRHLLENPRVAREIPDREIQELLRTGVHVQELARHHERAAQVRADAEQQESNLMIKLDPAGRRVLGFWLGAVMIAVLTVLDAIPLNWAAEAFDLDPGGTWLVTFILVAASIGAMLGLELTGGQPKRRGVLVTVIAAGYLALLGLRTEFLTTVAGDSLLLAFLQAALLTAMSAGLVWCGAAILARTRYLGLSRARAAARRAAAAAEEARAAHRLARHIGGLHHMVYPWTLSSAVPEGVDHADWIAALDQAIHVLFRSSPPPY